MLELKRHIINPPLRPSVQVTKLPTTVFMFLRVPLTQLDRWLAFFTKFPRDYRCSQTINAPREDLWHSGSSGWEQALSGFFCWLFRKCAWCRYLAEQHITSKSWTRRRTYWSCSRCGWPRNWPIFTRWQCLPDISGAAKAAPGGNKGAVWNSV